MLNANAKKWVEALRSGEFKQANGCLHTLSSDGDCYCCLGVACLVYQKEVGGLVVDQAKENIETFVSYDGCKAALPEAVRCWLNLSGHLGEFEDERDGFDWEGLAEMNDEGIPFEAIADMIESEPDGLFISEGD